MVFLPLLYQYNLQRMEWITRWWQGPQLGAAMMPTQWPVPHWQATDSIGAILSTLHPIGGLANAHQESRPINT